MARFPFAEVYWLPRDVGHQLAHGTLLVEAVRQRVDIPASACAQAQSTAESSLSDEVLWERAAGGNALCLVAAESSTVKTLRRYLIGERDLDRATVNFMAYWC